MLPRARIRGDNRCGVNRSKLLSQLQLRRSHRVARARLYFTSGDGKRLPHLRKEALAYARELRMAFAESQVAGDLSGSDS